MVFLMFGGMAAAFAQSPSDSLPTRYDSIQDERLESLERLERQTGRRAAKTGERIDRIEGVLDTLGAGLSEQGSRLEELQLQGRVREEQLLRLSEALEEAREDHREYRERLERKLRLGAAVFLLFLLAGLLGLFLYSSRNRYRLEKLKARVKKIRKSRRSEIRKISRKEADKRSRKEVARALSRRKRGKRK